MGRPVPLGGGGSAAAAAQVLAGWLSSAAWSDTPWHGGHGSARRRWGPVAAGMLPDHGRRSVGFGACGCGSDAPLHGTEFELALGGDEVGDSRSGRRWSVWGQGDIQTFAGAPTVFGYDARYDGYMRTGYVGVDARLAEGWLAGVAAARSGSGGDWTVGASSGRMTTTLTALHPYVHWSDRVTSVWTTVAAGWGVAENAREATGLVGSTDLGLRLGLVEMRRRVGVAGGGSEFGVRADAAWAELRTGDGAESVDGLAASVHQQRVGTDVSRAVQVGGLSLQPYGEAHLRRDGGAGHTGSGVELAFGLRTRSGIVRLDVQGRVLAVHSAAGYRERGAGVTLAAGGQGREGLSLSVSPRWGAGAAGTGALWQEEIYRRYLPETVEERWTVDARGDYGMRLPSGVLMTWFGSYSQSPYYGRRFLVGGRIGGLAETHQPGRSGPLAVFPD